MNPEVITTSQLPDEVLDAIREGRKIEAIKMLREETGLGLANAKVLVDNAWRDHGPARPVKSFDDQAAGHGRLITSFVLFLAVASAWYFYTVS
jgi:hypothetical protein